MNVKDGHLDSQPLPLLPSFPTLSNTDFFVVKYSAGQDRVPPQNTRQKSLYQSTRCLRLEPLTGFYVNIRPSHVVENF